MLCSAIPCLVYDLLPVAPDIDSFTIPEMGNVLGVVFCHLQPVLSAFLAEVALDDEITPPLQDNVIELIV